MVFESIRNESFEQIIYCHDPRVGLRGIISVHSTVLGPGVGGCRVWAYASESDALTDVLRLSKGMTYKASLANLNWGGGKAIIWLNEKQKKTPEMFQRFGELVDRLGGSYVTAKDVGTNAEDLKNVKSKTEHVLGIDGEPGSSGDPSPATAFGVYHGIRSAVQFALGSSTLSGLRIAIQGLGSVSYYLCEYLKNEGAQLIGCDIDAAAVTRATQKYGVSIVPPEVIYDQECDVFVPGAMGAILNSKTIPRIKAKVIAGHANNQLATPEDGEELRRRGVLYAPDYAINAGGLINIYYERPDGIHAQYNKEKAYAHVARIGQTMTEIFKRSQTERLPTHLVADRMAEERIENARKK